MDSINDAINDSFKNETTTAKCRTHIFHKYVPEGPVKRMAKAMLFVIYVVGRVPTELFLSISRERWAKLALLEPKEHHATSPQRDPN